MQIASRYIRVKQKSKDKEEILKSVREKKPDTLHKDNVSSDC